MHTYIHCTYLNVCLRRVYNTAACEKKNEITKKIALGRLVSQINTRKHSYLNAFFILSDQEPGPKVPSPSCRSKKEKELHVQCVHIVPNIYVCKPKLLSQGQEITNNQWN